MLRLVYGHSDMFRLEHAAELYKPGTVRYRFGASVCAACASAIRAHRCSKRIVHPPTRGHDVRCCRWAAYSSGSTSVHAAARSPGLGRLDLSRAASLPKPVWHLEADYSACNSACYASGGVTTLDPHPYGGALFDMPQRPAPEAGGSVLPRGRAPRR